MKAQCVHQDSGLCETCFKYEVLLSSSTLASITRKREDQRFPNRLSASEYERLVAWIKDPKRKPAHIAFTASACRDAARAIEASEILKKREAEKAVIEAARKWSQHPDRGLTRHLSEEGYAIRNTLAALDALEREGE